MSFTKDQKKKQKTTKKAQTKKHILVCKDIFNHLPGLWQYNFSFKSCIQSIIVSLEQSLFFSFQLNNRLA